MTKEGADLAHPETPDHMPMMVYAGRYREPTLRTNGATARRGGDQHRTRKGKTKPPQTRNSQSQRRHKRPNRNQPQPLGRRRKHSIVYTGAIPPARGFKYHWFVLELVPGVMFGGGFVLAFRLSASSVAFGRSFWRRFRLIHSLVRLRCWFWTLS